MIISLKTISLPNLYRKSNSEEDYFIYDADDEVIVEWLENNSIQAKALPFIDESRSRNYLFR
jgi:hypothetical protein